MDTPLKVCKDCEQSFPATIEYFQAEPRTKCGLKPRCIACYRAHHANTFKAWRDRNPEKDQLTRKKWSENNADRIRELDRNRYKRDAEKRKQWQKEYRRKYPHKTTKSPRNILHKIHYKTIQRNLPSSFTAVDWESALKHFDGRCAACGRPRGFWHKIVPDHWIPISSPDCPGTIPSNMIPLCHGSRGCNNRKQNRDALQWLCETFGKTKGRKIFDRIEGYLHSITLKDAKG